MLVSRSFLDIPSNFRDNAPLYGGAGILTDTFLLKPVFRVLRSFTNMETHILENIDGCLIGGNSKYRSQIILYNYRHFDPLFYTMKESDIQPEYLNRFLEKPVNKTFHIELNNIDNCEYQVEIYSCNSHHGSPLDLWIKKGCFEYNGKYRLLSLMLDSPLNVNTYVAKAEHGTLTFDITLSPLEFMSINIMKKNML